MSPRSSLLVLACAASVLLLPGTALANDIRSDTAVEVAVATKEQTVGEQFTVVVTFVNESTAANGPFDVFNASMSIEFSATFSVVSLSSIDHGTCSSTAGFIGCSFQSFPAGQRADLTIVFEATEIGEFDLVATVTHPAFDPDTTNNTVTCPFVVGGPGSISGTKFHDLNANEVRDAAEPGLAGWTITLSGQSTGTQVTAADGTYSFTGLVDGTYRVAETVQTGWIQSFPVTLTYTVDITNGAAKTGRDFGNYRNGAICGGKYRDADANFSLSATEKAQGPLQDWTVTLHDSEGVQIATAQTAADGTYCFPDLKPGSYEVREASRTNWVFSAPQSGSIGVTITSGQTVLDQDFANYATGFIEIFKFTDLNANGIDEAFDLAAAGVGFQVTSQFGSIPAIGVSAVTDNAGIARIGPIPTGSWRVTEVVPLDLFGGVSTNNVPGTVVVTEGGTVSLVVGNYFNGTISGKKWQDVDRNQIQNGQEPGLAGWTIELFQGGTSQGTATTDADGNYIFEGVKPGDYVVGEQFDPPWEQVFPLEATGSATHPVTVRSSESVENVNFGNVGLDADLSVVKTAPDVVTKGQVFVFSITVANVGQVPLENVAMQDIVDTANFEIMAISGAGACTNTDGTVDCAYGGLAVGESRVTSIRVRAIGIGLEKNGATATTSSPDVNSENNRSDIEVLIQFADIAVQKAVSETALELDQTTVFTITVTNTRTSEAAGVTMQDVVPAELEIVSVAGPPAATCTTRGQTIDCALGDLAGGASVVITVTAKAVARGNVTNTATGATTSEEANTTNNSSAVDIQIGGLGMTVTFDEDICRGSADPVTDGVSDGNLVTVTIRVTNFGDDPESYALEVTSDTTIPGASGLGGTVAGRATNTHTFDWDTEGLAWKSPNVARLLYNFLIKLKQGEATKAEHAEAIKMLPKPLILAHGLWSSAGTWGNYPGFAKTAHANWEGRVVAVKGMKTGVEPGITLDPKTIGSSRTIDENAAVLHSVIEAEREKSKSCKVDVVGHSMGGLITRSYVDSIMPIDPIRVSHAVQIGTPNEGAICAAVAFNAVLALRVNVFRPADLVLAPFPRNLYELSPDWVINVFNKTRINQRDVPFWVLAGNVERLNDALGPLAACTMGVPNDGLVEQPSAWSTTSRTPSFVGRRTAVVNHVDEPPSSLLFFNFVLPIVSGGTVEGDGMIGSRPAARIENRDLVDQGTATITGGVASASFVVDESSRLDAVLFMGEGTNALLRDPAGSVVVTSDTLSSRSGPFVTLSVGQPAVGAWTLEFAAPADTALSGFSVYETDSQRSLEVGASTADGLIQITASLDGVWSNASVEATVYSPDSVAVIPLALSAGAEYTASYKPSVPGAYAMRVSAAGDGASRSSFAVLDVDQLTITLDKGDPVEIPETSALGAGYPNPAGDLISFPLELEATADVVLRVVDVTGRTVLTLPQRSLGGGLHTLEVATGSLANGSYILEGRVGDAHIAQQFVVIHEE
jgi:uncharacterized repeat protein (TIGR01451 family)